MENLGVYIFMSALLISFTQFIVANIKNRTKVKKIENDRDRLRLWHREEMERLELKRFKLEQRYNRCLKKKDEG